MADELQPKQPKQPKLAPQGMATEKGLSGGKVQPGSPNKLDLAAAGINKGKLESQKHADKRMNALFKKTGQPTLGQWNYEKRNNPMAEPDKVKFNPTFDKTQQINERLAQKPLGKPDPEFETRQKIMNQGFAPKSYDPKTGEYNNQEQPSKTKKLWDRYNSLSDDQKKDFALNVYHYGTDTFDNPVGKFRDPYTGEIMYADAENNYEDKSDYLLANDEDSRAQLEEAVNLIGVDNMSDEEIEKLFSEHDTEDLEPWDEEEENSEPQQPQVNTEQTRKVLRSMGYKDDQIDMIFNSMPETYGKKSTSNSLNNDVRELYSPQRWNNEEGEEGKWIGTKTIDAFDKLGEKIPDNLKGNGGQDLAVMARLSEQTGKPIENIIQEYLQSSKYYRKQLLDYWKNKIYNKR